MKKLALLLVLGAMFAAGFWLGKTGGRRVSEVRSPAETAPVPVTAPKTALEEIIARLENECRQGIWHRTKEWEVLFNSASAAEIASLMASVRHLVLAASQEELRHALFSRWAECDPEAALAFARGLPESALREGILRA